MTIENRSYLEDALAQINQNIKSDPAIDVKVLINNMANQFNLKEIQKDYLFEVYTNRHN